MSAELVQLDRTNIQDIPKVLRQLADQIESGDFGEISNLAWITKDSEGELDIGLLGEAGVAVETLLFLLARAQAVLVDRANNG